MRGLHWRILREDDLLTTVAAAGVNRNIRIEGIPTRIDNRDVVVVAFALHSRAKLSTQEVTDQPVNVREAQSLMHGAIQLPGRNSVGLIPTTMEADAIGLLNLAHGLGNGTLALGNVGALIDGFTVDAEDGAEVESTLILPYAPRALAAQRSGLAGSFDGAIDAEMFNLAPPTLHQNHFGRHDSKIDLDELQQELWVCLATMEPGEALGPTRPQMLLLGDIVNNPQHYGIGDLADIQSVAILSNNQDPDDDLDVFASAASAALEIDGTEITEAPWRALVRMPLQEGYGGSLWAGYYAWANELTTAILLHPAILPRASQRHVGSRISIEGFAADFEPSYAVAFVTMAPEREVLSAFAAARNIDLSSARVHGEKIAETGLSDRRFVGISPVYSKRGR